jgi:hypothetical protein
MVRYIKEKAPLNDPRALALAKRVRLDLIEVPEEFKDIPIDDMNIKMDKRSRRTIIRNRSSKDLRHYDAWRVHDRNIYKGGGRAACIAKLMLPPAALVRAFGLPTLTRTGFDGTGEYDFEDHNLDVYNLYDFR